jgi:type I restriction enzyme M protein
VLPHGVLFRGNSERAIRRKLIECGLIAGVVGLPANLFYGTGIPACLVVLDKGRAAGAPIMMIDASRGFVKDGPKNRLRHQDVHRVIDSWQKQAEVPGFARLVHVDEIERNGFNLNLPRYIDGGMRTDRHDLAAHLQGGIPTADVETMADWWTVMPNLRGALFRPGARADSVEPIPASDDVRALVSQAPEFIAFAGWVQTTFDGWRAVHIARLEGIDADTRGKVLVETLAEDLLDRFRPLPLIDAYDVYQRLMTIWDEGMGDDVGVLARDGWAAARRIEAPGEGETPDIVLGSGRAKRRLRAELITPALIVKRFFAPQAVELADAEVVAERLAGEIEALAEEQGGEDGLLTDGLDDKGALSEKVAKARAKAIKADNGGRAPTPSSAFAEEWGAITAALALIERRKAADARVKALRAALDEQTVARYATLTEAEAKQLIVHDKWLLSLETSILLEVVRMAGELAGRARTLIERYDTPLPALVAAREAATVRVRDHLAAMGVAWN